MKPSAENDRIEVGLLSLIFDLHPEHLTAAELVQRMKPSDPDKQDEDGAIERALRSLQNSGLVEEEDGLMIPTPAALHFDRLPF